MLRLWANNLLSPPPIASVLARTSRLPDAAQLLAAARTHGIAPKAVADLALVQLRPEDRPDQGTHVAEPAEPPLS